MWPNNKIESIAKQQLDVETEIVSTEELWEGYETLKKYLCRHVLPNIARSEPHLTDHSEEHIQDVQSNIYTMIVSSIDSFNTAEIYFLTYASLIHDIGNIFGRAGHEHRAKEIIKDFPFNSDAVKRIAYEIAKAHGGKGDTIKKLESTVSYENFPIKAQEIASIIRFADECAEGEQRCYTYGLEKNMIAEDSIIFHLYAKDTKLFIDRNSIKLTYRIHLESEQLKTLSDLKDYLTFIFGRINKTNWERIYCAQYSQIVSKYTCIDIVIELAKDTLDETFYKTSFSINNMTMLECTSDPANSIDRIKEMIEHENVQKYFS